jgi:titin
MDLGSLPSAPANGGFMYISPTTVTLSWNAPENDGGSPITTYLLSLTSDGQPTTEQLLQAPQNSYEVDNLVHGISVQATVKASNNDGITYGPEFMFAPIVPILPPSSPPASAEASATVQGVATISWTPPETAPEGYAYYLIVSQSSNPSDPSVGFGTRDMTQLSCTLSELNPSSEYSFTVQIVNQVGRSPVTTTNTIVFTSLPPPTIEEPILIPH